MAKSRVAKGILDWEVAEPRADAMFESMRAVGYSLEAAIADLVDNSISAGARNVWIDLHWAGPASSAVCLDDGRGLEEEDLKEAMRLGSVNPLELRPEEDLGRFGLGLKTASVSQCRLLSVRSKRGDAAEATRVWDLDYINQVREWRLRKEANEQTLPLLAGLDSVKHGTIVVWQKMDRVVDERGVDDTEAKNEFNSKIARVEQHIAMTFHRFMEEHPGISFLINSREIEPWDPFLKNESKTQELSEEALQIFDQSLAVRPFVLPHRSHLREDVHRRAAGPNGWNAQQGFYVYRNRRLIVAGSWLNLGFLQEEHYKLARILVDLPNTMDHDWQIDVRKAQATPPAALAPSLKRLARLTRSRAADVYRGRGQVVRRRHAGEYELVWDQKVKHGKIYFKVNRSHPLVKEALAAAPEIRRQIKAVIELMENTVPVDAIIIANTEKSDSVSLPEEWEEPKDLEARGIALFKAFLAEGMSREEALTRLALTEPFDRLPSVLAAVEAVIEVERHG